MLQEPSLVSGFASMYIMQNPGICDNIQDLLFLLSLNLRSEIDSFFGIFKSFLPPGFHLFWIKIKRIVNTISGSIKNIFDSESLKNPKVKEFIDKKPAFQKLVG